MKRIPETFCGVGYARDRAGLPLEAVRVPVPRPADGQVLIRVAASSLNPLEYKLAELNFLGRTPPVALGFDVAGVVVEAGRDVTRVAVGDEVAAMADLNGNGGWAATGDGAYAVAHEFLTARRPPSLSRRDAAALPMCFLSAFAGLYGHVQAGDVVHIPGGGGGVGHLAVQIAARTRKARTVVSSGGRPSRSRWPGVRGRRRPRLPPRRRRRRDRGADRRPGRRRRLRRDLQRARLRRDREDRPAGRRLDRPRGRPRQDDPRGRERPARSTPSWPSAAPGTSTSTCCATSPNPRRWTARPASSSPTAWTWPWSGRVRDWWSRMSAVPSPAPSRGDQRGLSALKAGGVLGKIAVDVPTGAENLHEE